MTVTHEHALEGVWPLRTVLRHWKIEERIFSFEIESAFITPVSEHHVTKHARASAVNKYRGSGHGAKRSASVDGSDGSDVGWFEHEGFGLGLGLGLALGHRNTALNATDAGPAAAAHHNDHSFGSHHDHGALHGHSRFGHHAGEHGGGHGGDGEGKDKGASESEHEHEHHTHLYGRTKRVLKQIVLRDQIGGLPYSANSSILTAEKQLMK